MVGLEGRKPREKCCDNIKITNIKEKSINRKIVKHVLTERESLDQSLE